MIAPLCFFLTEVASNIEVRRRVCTPT